MFDVLEKQRAGLERALPRHIPVDRYLRVVMTEMRKTPQLVECTPASLLGAVMTSAQLGLEFGPLGHAYLVPYWSSKNQRRECQLIMGYKGMIALARRSGDISYIVAREVRENDHFEFEYGLDERLVHRPSLENRGEVKAYYGVAKFRDGGHLVEVMSLSEIDKRKARSQSTNRNGEIVGPWVSDYDAMAKKTVIRTMAPWLPLTIEVASVLANDEGVIDLRGEDFEVHYPELPEGDESQDEPEDGPGPADDEPDDEPPPSGEDPF